jgi:NAD(P)-dependent dehydrogenase (short-subunit alcohol dehydrogenase family)
MTLSGKTIIITGAAKGMGRASAKLCAERGAAIVAADLDGDGLDSLVKEIKDAGGSAVSRVTDVTVENEVQALIDAAVAEFGSVNVLYNNAVHPDASGDVLSTTLEAWDWTIRTCVTSQFLCARATIPHMIRAGGGSIINVSSGNGLNGASTSAAYGVAKAGSAIFTKYLATQYGKQGIRANTIVPGWTVETGWTGPVKDMNPQGRRCCGRRWRTSA